jgi:hypothetical protein
MDFFKAPTANFRLLCEVRVNGLEWPFSIDRYQGNPSTAS